APQSRPTHHGWTPGVSGGRGAGVRGRDRLRDPGEAVRDRAGGRGALLTAKVCRDAEGSEVGRARRRTYLHELRGAAEPEHAHGDAALHETDERVLEEDR